MAEQLEFARVVVITDRVWRAEQLAQFVTAMDGLCTRLAWAAGLADMLKQSDWVLANARIYGLMDKGPPKDWAPAGQSAEGLSRSDYLKWTLMLRSYGIRVREEQLSWSLAFDSEDLLDTVPTVNRCEIESVSMSSPGWLTFLTAGMHAKPGFFSLIRHFFDSIRWPSETRRIMQAAAMVAEAKAAGQLAKSLQTLKKTMESDLHSHDVAREPAHLAASGRPQPGDSLQVSFDKDRDTLSLALRDAGLPLAEVQRVILGPVQGNANTIYQCVAQGLVQYITVGPESTEGKSG